MTLMKEKAVEMIRRMPEDNMTYVINILQNLEAMSADRSEDKKRAQNALAEILSMEKRLPDDFDPEKEIREARTEKYENPS
ncbi:MAG: dihydrodipicolinate reductase [Lachnospiraceae bacterium]|nr:dihydrodipicolinate reductase [Lachnospiraceae bacterium]MDE7198936.1 dihydrodipicolinate reductase [Lachnospiraceae bacterium]